MRLFGVLLLFSVLFSCKDDPTIVELTIIDENLMPIDSAMVIFTGDPYDSSFSNEIIFNDTFYTDSTGFIKADFSDRQINGQTGFVTALIKVSTDSLASEFNMNIPQFETTKRTFILQ